MCLYIERDINIAVNGCSGFATSTQKGPFMAMLISGSRGTYLIDVHSTAILIHSVECFLTDDNIQDQSEPCCLPKFGAASWSVGEWRAVFSRKSSSSILITKGHPGWQGRGEEGEEKKSTWSLDQEFEPNSVKRIEP